MLTIINRTEELHNLFTKYAFTEYRERKFHFKYPLIIFGGFLDIFDFKSKLLLFSNSNQRLNTEMSVTRGKGNNHKYLIFNKVEIIKFYYKRDNEEIFFGINMFKLIVRNAKITLFINAINDNNSNVAMLNYDIINYILSFYGPFSLLKK